MRETADDTLYTLAHASIRIAVCGDDQLAEPPRRHPTIVAKGYCCWRFVAPGKRPGRVVREGDWGTVSVEGQPTDYKMTVGVSPGGQVVAFVVETKLAAGKIDTQSGTLLRSIRVLDLKSEPAPEGASVSQ